MGDMISRRAAIDYFVTNVGFHDEDGYPIEDECELREIWTGYFDGIPSAQPEIIYCNDCKYNYGLTHGGEFNPDDIVCTYFDTDGMRYCDYCSYGERREVNDESD